MDSRVGSPPKSSSDYVTKKPADAKIGRMAGNSGQSSSPPKKDYHAHGTGTNKFNYLGHIGKEAAGYGAAAQGLMGSRGDGIGEDVEGTKKVGGSGAARRGVPMQMDEYDDPDYQIYMKSTVSIGKLNHLKDDGDSLERASNNDIDGLDAGASKESYLEQLFSGAQSNNRTERVQSQDRAPIPIQGRANIAKNH